MLVDSDDEQQADEDVNAWIRTGGNQQCGEAQGHRQQGEKQLQKAQDKSDC